MAGSRSSARKRSKPAVVPRRSLVAEPRGGDQPLPSLDRAARDRRPRPRREPKIITPTAPGASPPAIQPTGVADPRVDLLARSGVRRAPAATREPGARARGVDHDRCLDPHPSPCARPSRRRARCRPLTVTPSLSCTRGWRSTWVPDHSLHQRTGGRQHLESSPAAREPAVLAQPGHGTGVGRHGSVPHSIRPEAGQQGLDHGQAAIAAGCGPARPGERRGGRGSLRERVPVEQRDLVAPRGPGPRRRTARPCSRRSRRRSGGPTALGRPAAGRRRPRSSADHRRLRLPGP